MILSDSANVDSTASDPGTWLLHLLHGLPREGAERSFKMSTAALLADRYLIGVHKSDIGPDALYGLCSRMGMPGAFLAAMKAEAPAANAFHFGYEGRGVGGLYKVYLEFASRLRTVAKSGVLLHLAFKWECGERANPDARTIARYVCHPGLDCVGIVERLREIYPGPSGEAVFGVVAEVIDQSARRTAEPLMYLEVSEEGNPRASYDVKLHDADIRMGEIAAPLARLGAHYAIARPELEALLCKTQDARLGHLSGGTSRAGADFLTVYYAADGL